MIDTIRIESPALDKETLEKVTSFCMLRCGIDFNTGNLIYHFTQADLKGSYDYRISIQVRDYTFTRAFSDNPKKVKCDPYLVVECSVHKLMLGHNVYGGTDNFHVAVKVLIDTIERFLEVDLPYYLEWTVKRIDYAKAYLMESNIQVKNFVRALNTVEYTRRKVVRYGDVSLHASGDTTVVKLYSKGDEFKKHDRRRLMNVFDDVDLMQLSSLANKILRAEVEIKSQKLKNDVWKNTAMYKKESIKVKYIQNEYIEKVYYNEIEKLLKEGENGMEVMRSAYDVESCLYSYYDSRMASILYGTWAKLALHGENYCKSRLPRSTFYDHKKLLKKAGVSWEGTDIRISEGSAIPVNFNLKKGSIFELKEKHKTVMELERCYIPSIIDDLKKENILQVAI